MAECLLFDCDGTLVDSERLCNIGLVLMFRKLGIELDADELIFRFRGWKLADILKVLAQECEISLSPLFVDEYRQRVTDLFDTQLQPIDGVEAVLRHLNQPMAVVSSGPRLKIEHALSVCGLSHYFGDNIYSAYDIGVWKPDPGIYLHAAADMGYQVEQCVVIEDGLVGVEAGYKAGMKTLFYNPSNEVCHFSSVISFNAMKALPALLSA